MRKNGMASLANSSIWNDDRLDQEIITPERKTPLYSERRFHVHVNQRPNHLPACPEVLSPEIEAAGNRESFGHPM
jgi:hypothetical protein